VQRANSIDSIIFWSFRWGRVVSSTSLEADRKGILRRFRQLWRQAELLKLFIKAIYDSVTDNISRALELFALRVTSKVFAKQTETLCIEAYRKFLVGGRIEGVTSMHSPLDNTARHKKLGHRERVNYFIN